MDYERFETLAIRWARLVLPQPWDWEIRYNASESTLGVTYPGERVIMFSTRHMQAWGVDTAVRVILHELAHAMVAEADVTEASHGPTWRSLMVSWGQKPTISIPSSPVCKWLITCDGCGGRCGRDRVKVSGVDGAPCRMCGGRLTVHPHVGYRKALPGCYTRVIPVSTGVVEHRSWEYYRV